MTNKKVKDFLVINFSEYFKSITEEQVAKSLYIFLSTPDEVEKYVQSNSSDNCIHHYNIEILNLFDAEFQMITAKSVVKNKLKELLSELKNFKLHTILVLDQNLPFEY